jgi:DnaJ-domain-containing protein 1
LNFSRFKGKIIGAAIGAVAGPVGIVVGILIGHLYDARRSSFGREDWEEHVPKPPCLSDRRQAYRVLGVTPDCSTEEIKRVYRRLVSIYHPDRASSLGKEFLLLAEKKTQAINDAYTQIREERGF